MPKSRSLVISFGRFNPPTTGHAKLVALLQREASRLQADVILFPSMSQDAQRNPLPFAEKVWFLRQLFPQVKVSDNDVVRTPIRALKVASEMGYDRVYVVVGSDRAAEFQRFAKYVKPTGARTGEEIILSHYEVIVVAGERDPDSDAVEGMSASKLRAHAVANDFAAFQKGVPTQNISLARRLFASVRKHMNLREAFAQFYRQPGVRSPVFIMNGPLATFFRESLPQVTCPVVPIAEVTARSARVRNLLEMRDPFIVDAETASWPSVRQLVASLDTRQVRPVVYVKESVRLNEGHDWIRMRTRHGMMRVEVPCAVITESMRDVYTHMRDTLVTEADMKPKQPSEADRLKVSQKQQEIELKQRQGREMLQAKSRELQKKSREDANKLASGA
jgi:hypothetical protein